MKKKQRQFVGTGLGAAGGGYLGHLLSQRFLHVQHADTIGLVGGILGGAYLGNKLAKKV